MVLTKDCGDNYGWAGVVDEALKRAHLRPPPLPQQRSSNAYNGPKGTVALGRREAEFRSELRPTFSLAHCHLRALQEAFGSCGDSSNLVRRNVSLSLLATALECTEMVPSKRKRMRPGLSLGLASPSSNVAT